MQYRLELQQLVAGHERIDGGLLQRNADRSSNVIAFAHNEMTGLPSTGPKNMAFLLCREAQRIVHANVETVATQDFNYVSPGGLTKVVDREQDPVLFMVQFLIGYSRFEDP